MNKYILIDLEDTITIHKYKNRLENIMIEWLKYNKVVNPKQIVSNERFKNRESRISLLNIDNDEYKNWYKNFNDIEFQFYKKKYEDKQIEINNETIDFIMNSNIPLILVSNSSPKWIDFILEEYEIKKYFKYIFKRTYEFNDVKKPNKEIIKIIENEIDDKISPDSIIVGDSKIDYEFALNCNLKFISIYNTFDNEICFYNFKTLSDYFNK